MNIEEMIHGASEASELMKSLSSARRLMVLCCLVDGECPVWAIAERLDLPQATVSQQLARLRADGLVKTRREGQTVYYSTKGKAARKLIRVLHDLFCVEETRVQ